MPSSLPDRLTGPTPGGFCLTRPAPLWYSRAFMTIHRKEFKTFSAVATTRWSAYAAAGAACALAGASSAEAVIHVVDVNEIFDGPPLGSGTQAGTFPVAKGVSFVMAHDTVGGSFGFDGFGILGHGAQAAFNGGSLGGTYVSRLGLGADIAREPFAPGGFGILAAGDGSGGNSQWVIRGQGYIGFEFNAGGGEQYGWVSVTMDSGPALNTFTLNSYAYGDVGDVVLAGEVPEPGSLGLLALGGAGLLAWRQRRVARA